MKAALLPTAAWSRSPATTRGHFLHGLLSADILNLAPGTARFAALLTPQGKIIADFIVAEAPAQATAAASSSISRGRWPAL